MVHYERLVLGVSEVLCGFVTARALVPLTSALFKGQLYISLGSTEINEQSPTCCHSAVA